VDQSNTVQPTPRPWLHRGSLIVAMHPEHGRVIARMMDIDGYELDMREPEWSEAMANAAHIVRCVNAFDDLLRGCKAALAYLADPPSNFHENRKETAEIIRSAIAKATA